MHYTHLPYRRRTTYAFVQNVNQFLFEYLHSVQSSRLYRTQLIVQLSQVHKSSPT